MMMRGNHGRMFCRLDTGVRDITYSSRVRPGIDMFSSTLVNPKGWLYYSQISNVRLWISCQKPGQELHSSQSAAARDRVRTMSRSRGFLSSWSEQPLRSHIKNLLIGLPMVIFGIVCMVARSCDCCGKVSVFSSSVDCCTRSSVAEHAGGEARWMWTFSPTCCLGPRLLVKRAGIDHQLSNHLRARQETPAKSKTIKTWQEKYVW